jgi:hypothetical protein
MDRFDFKLEMLARKFMPKHPVKVGDVVETKWGNWKKSHKVKIYEIGIHLISRNDIRARGKNESLYQWRLDSELMGIDLYFYALRLNKDGTAMDEIGSGIALTNLKIDNYEWNEKHTGFNHIGLSWPIEQLTDK